MASFGHFAGLNCSILLFIHSAILQVAMVKRGSLPTGNLAFSKDCLSNPQTLHRVMFAKRNGTNTKICFLALSAVFNQQSSSSNIFEMSVYNSLMNDEVKLILNLTIRFGTRWLLMVLQSRQPVSCPNVSSTSMRDLDLLTTDTGLSSD